MFWCELHDCLNIFVGTWSIESDLFFFVLFCTHVKLFTFLTRPNEAPNCKKVKQIWTNIKRPIFVKTKKNKIAQFCTDTFFLSRLTRLPWLFLSDSGGDVDNKQSSVQRQHKYKTQFRLFLPFVRKEPSPRWCKVRKRCSCVRTDWRTCPTPTWLPLRWLTDFPRFRCSLRGTKA